MQTQIKPLTENVIQGVIDGMGFEDAGPFVVTVLGPDGKRITWRSIGGDVDELRLQQATEWAAGNRNGHGFSVGAAGAGIGDIGSFCERIDQALQVAVTVN